MSTNLFYFSISFLSRKWRQCRNRWDALPPDVVVLHQLRRPNTALSLSPFIVKLETFLRMANIKYVNDFDFPKSPNTLKSPWITFNGEDIADSQVIIETLTRRLGKDLR